MSKPADGTGFQKGPIDGVVVAPLKKFVDERGWLSELYRIDEVEKQYWPVMSYISVTEPGITRGPHEHVDQTDLFCFLGPSNFKVRLWDNRESSPTRNRVMTVFVGADNPASVLVPPGVVHAYRNIGGVPGVVMNFPNQLFMGDGKRSEVDEIRHEDDPNTPYVVDGDAT